MTRPSPKTAAAIGGVLVACGVLLNVWILALFSRDGILQGATQVTIWTFDVICVTVGLLLIKHRVAVSQRGFRVLGRPLAIIYLLLSVLTFTSILIFVALNVIAAPAARYISANAPKRIELEEAIERVTGMNPADWSQLRSESSGWQFEPWLGFRERPRKGKFVNVTPAGLRPTHRRDLSLGDEGINVYVFGGSTTFGYGVDDESTIPAYLQRHLSAAHPESELNVYHFGRGYYYSSQEMALLVQLVKTGRAPDIAVFIDGVNEGQAVPHYTAEMTWMHEIFNAGDSRPLFSAAVERLPLMKLIARFTGRKNRFQQLNLYTALTPEEMRDQYVQSKQIVQALAERYSFTPYFFIQPVPGHRNEFLHHTLQTQDYLDQYEYTLKKIKLLEETVDDKTSFSMTHLLENYESEPFLDSVHYVADVHDLIGKFIAERIRIPAQ